MRDAHLKDLSGRRLTLSWNPASSKDSDAMDPFIDSESKKYNENLREGSGRWKWLKEIMKFRESQSLRYLIRLRV